MITAILCYALVHVTLFWQFFYRESDFNYQAVSDMIKEFCYVSREFYGVSWTVFGFLDCSGVPLGSELFLRL